MEVLDIFAHRFGDETHPGNLSSGDDNSLGDAGLRMLDAIQTVVDVLADDVNKGYSVGFTNVSSAYTEHSKKRITISGKPLTTAAKGTPYREIAAVLTGFAVHEVGHTKRVGIIDAVRKEWPSKKLPAVLANVVEDMVLEARTIERYAGFTDVFTPTFEWVAAETCPKSPIKYSGTSGHKVNFVGQVLRYRDFVTFAPDALTQQELLWWEEWGSRIDATTDGPKAVKLIREAIEHIAEPEPETEDEPEGPTTDGGDEPGGEDEDEDGDEDGDGTKGPSIPDEDEDDTEGDDGDGESDEDGGSEGGDTEGDTEDGEGGGNPTDEDGDSEADSDSDGDGDGDGGRSGDGLDADTQHRLDGEKGSTDGDGAGGSGQTVAEASDPAEPEDFDEQDLDKSFDDLNESNSYADRILEQAIAEERTTTRLDAGQFGKMRVIFR